MKTKLGFWMTVRVICAAVIVLAIAISAAQAATASPEEEAKAKAAAIKAANAEVAVAEKALAKAKATAAKVAADEKVEAIKAAARKAAQQRISDRKGAIVTMTDAVKAKDAGALEAFKKNAFKEKIARDKNAVQEAKTAMAEAEKALAEKEKEVVEPEAVAKAAATAAAASPGNEELAKNAADAKKAEERAQRSRNGALNTVRSRKATADAAEAQVKRGVEVTAKLAEVGGLDKAYESALANAAAAKKAVSEKDSAARSAAKAAATAKSTAKKNKDDKALASKAAAAEASARKLAAAKIAADKARGEADKKAAAAKKVAGETNSVILAFNTTAVAEKIDQERRAHLKAVTEKTAALKAVKTAAAAASSATSKAAAAKSTNDKAVDASKAAQGALAKAKEAEKKAQSALAKANEAAKKAEGKNAAKAAATVKAEGKNVAKATSNRKAVEKKLAQVEAAAKKAAATHATARATADKAAAAEKAAGVEFASKEAPIRNALDRLYDAQALVAGGLAPLPADQWDYAKARHLLCRAGFGGTPQEVEALHAMGLHQAVEFMVDFQDQSILDLPFNAVLPERPLPNESRLDRQRRRDMTNIRRRVESSQQTRLRDWWLERMARSPRQLEEKLTLFWHGHFATEYRTVRSSYAMYLQNQLFREHAAGNFGALLHGIVHDPAMLRYLDNNSNIKGRPNENLAREIMELFSLGEGNYTEEDIMEGARALTGYTYDTYTSQFRFIVSRHDAEKKTIFGRTGAWAGDDFVDQILAQPFASRFIARKLFVFLTYENPDTEIVHRMATVFSKHQYEMGPMLKNLFMSKEFYSEKAMATQIKNPVQLAIGTLRDLGISELTSYGTLGSAVSGMGQEIFGPPNVRGWEGGMFWVNANRLFVRYNGIADLVDRATQPDQPRGLDVVGALEGQKLDTPGEVVDYLAKSCLIRPLTDDKKEVLIEQVASLPPCSEWESQKSKVNASLRALLVLILSMPEYQTI